jgi:glycosyltransferase involved in cell wall biosynthesis
MNPTVSVIMPAFNVEAYVAEAIESVLAQTRAPAEILVVDDGSTDRTAQILGRYEGKIRIFSQTNQGIGAARNTAIQQAGGDWLAFLDCDDRWLPQKLERQMAALQNSPAMDICFCHYLEMTERGEIIPSTSKPGELSSGTLIRRTAFAKVGPFGTQWKVGEFIDWMARARECGLQSLILPEVLNHRRLHAASTVVRERSSYGDYVSIVKQAIDRRRRG